MKQVALLCLVFLTGCEQQRQMPPPTPTPAPAAVVAVDYTPQIADLRQEMNAMRVRLGLVEAAQTPASAEFDPQAPKAYARVRAPSGALLIRLEKMEPYLDGFVVTFMVGNPTTATFAGAEGEVSWGQQIDWKDLKTLQSQSMKFKVQDRFPPGVWTPLKINIAPAKPEFARRITITPTFDIIAMRDAS